MVREQVAWPAAGRAGPAAGLRKGLAVTMTPVANLADVAGLTSDELQASVTSPKALCAGPSVDPDDWFPIVVEPVNARRQAARAIALCEACLVRAECLELALRLWSSAGHHGIWGGTVEAERRILREEWLAGASVGQLLERGPALGRAERQDLPG